jgi:hypothetical protein
MTKASAVEKTASPSSAAMDETTDAASGPVDDQACGNQQRRAHERRSGRRNDWR